MSNTHEISPDWSFYEKNGLTPLINVSGTMTALGASIAVDAVASAMSEILPRFVKMHELQARASAVISEITGAEAGFITASASAGVSLSVAACITGLDFGRIEALPANPGPRSGVVVQLGHLCHYGAPIEQAIAMTGGETIPIGQSTKVMDYQLEAALDGTVAAGVYVVSHHVVRYGQIPLKRFAEICHAAGVPVVVDAASEYDLEGFLKDGADLVTYSAHKFMGGPTAGIVAGRRDLVRAAYAQNLGIGRGMKVGKETVFGSMAAMRAWKERDHAAIRRQEDEALVLWRDALAGLAGVDPAIIPDPTDNPLSRLRVRVDPAGAGATAAAVARALGQSRPAIIVRDHEVELGYFQLDPCNLAPGQAPIVAERLRAVFAEAGAGKLREPDLNDLRNGTATVYLHWLAD